MIESNMICDVICRITQCPKKAIDTNFLYSYDFDKTKFNSIHFLGATSSTTFTDKCWITKKYHIEGWPTKNFKTRIFKLSFNIYFIL